MHGAATQLLTNPLYLTAKLEAFTFIVCWTKLSVWLTPRQPLITPTGECCRIADDKGQAAATAVQAICSSKSSLVVTLRQPVALKPQLKRKRSTTKALEAARNCS